MAGDTTTLFTEEFNAELFVAFQNKGGMYRNKVRRKTGVIGYKSHFPKLGLGGTAQGKTRHGLVPTQDILRDRIAVTLDDKYAADFIDSLDELKTNVAERGAIQDALVMSLARTEDDYASTAILTSTNSSNNLTANETFSSDATFRLMQEVFGAAETMEEGSCYAVISWGAYSDLCALQSFIHANYGGNPAATSQHQVSKRYFGFDVSPYSRMPQTTAKAANHWFNTRCVGVAVGAEITPTTDWVPERDAWLVKAKLSMGAALIDSAGVVIRQYDAA
jgi:hypothetical protein